MIYVKEKGNCWTMGIGFVPTVHIGSLRIDLINPKHVIRVWRDSRSSKPTYTKDAWLMILKGSIYLDPIRHLRRPSL